ncbi:MAG TPA: ferritin-like domain-containing protein, partial [Alphaproteobacteria bacterium]|nr:ferritin-like domain-containing protein [Alphaproteobacteria bacterium]
AERQLTKALPKMARAAQSEQLRQAFQQHLEETRGQIERLEQAFELLGKPARGKVCEAMQGLVAEAQEEMEEIQDPALRDVALIAAAQKVEHYEIASYGTLRTLAQGMGQQELAQIFESILEEEKATDEKLNEVALSEVNQRALQQAGQQA